MPAVSTIHTDTAGTGAREGTDAVMFRLATAAHATAASRGARR